MSEANEGPSLLAEGNERSDGAKLKDGAPIIYNKNDILRSKIHYYKLLGRQTEA